MKRLLVAGLALFQAACSWLPRKTETPLPSRAEDAPGGSKELVVLLPGRLTTPAEFDREGFTELVRKAYPDARIVRPDLHIGYYRNRTAIDRLHEDVIVPARKAGLRKVTLVGISMGGLGAMLYDLEHPGVVDEMMLLSPFLGEDEVIAEIDRAGSVDAWDVEPEGERDFSRAIWKRIRERDDVKAAPIRLGCGTDDRLAPTSRLAERELPMQGAAVWLDGGHDWPTWRHLFSVMTGLGED